jgi:hypothetical protein
MCFLGPGVHRFAALVFAGIQEETRDRSPGGIPGYYLLSLAGLEYCGRELVVFLDAVRRGDPTPGGNARVSLFCCAGATRCGSPDKAGAI